MAIQRRQFLYGAAVGAAALSMPAIRVSAATRKITVGGYFDLADIIAKHWIAPFQEKFDAQVFFDPGTSVHQLSKMRAEKSNPKHSVMLMDENYFPIAKDEELILPLDEKLLPNLDQVDQRFVIGDGYGVGLAQHRIALAYNTKIAEPTSWNNLWDESLKQQVSTPTMQQNTWYHTFVAAAHLKSGRPMNEAHLEVDAAFEKLAELKPNLVTTHTNPANIVSLLEQGELMLVGAITSKNVTPFMARGLPIKIALPKEGSFLLLNSAALVRNGPEPELAAEFLNFGLSTEVQTAIAQHAAAGVVNKNVTVPENLKGIIPSTPEEYAAVHKVDWQFFLKHRAEWVDRWNRLMAG